MLLNLMITLMILISILFTFMKHPLSLGMMLMMQTIMLSLITGMMNMSFWFSYIIFIIMIGGLMILFIYMTSMVSNEKFKYSMKIIIIMMILLLLIYSSIKIFNSLLNLNNINMMNFMHYNNFMNENYEFLNKMYNKKFNFWMIILMNYLLMTLIMSVKITNLKYGPLRKKF
uniref:NADH-ubiquinone oxidoreductase chain 6 n=1 Tax=Noterus clavicornis BMNH1425090 TaxID=2558029 RepID=A0A191ZRU6_9COLE|nr:NADH dehydrogenase subunit 6 [Noterus clavicornis BMNH1425090]UPX88470.1 NADH dehydrogenase subunit 6 [Noterus clavicornis]